MLGLMFRKLWYKKWMFLCLLLGSVLLVATACSFPLYRNAVLNRMLQDEFKQNMETSNEWPVKIDSVIISKKNVGGKAMSGMEMFIAGLPEQFSMSEKQSILYYSVSLSEGTSVLKSETESVVSLRLGYMSGLPAHAALVDGYMYSESGFTEDGYIEVVISEAAMVNLKLIVGECIEMSALKDTEGNNLRLKVVGVFHQADDNDLYWQMDPDDMDTACLMNEELFRQYFTGEQAEGYTITCYYHVLFDYHEILAEQVGEIRRATQYIAEESAYKGVISAPDYLNILDTYLDKENRINTTLTILQIPVILLLCAFLFMISGQMYEMERNEISVLKSRGASRAQIFRLYLYQGIFFGVLGMAFGIPSGSVFSRILGSASSFLEFGITRNLNIRYSIDVFVYSAAAATVLILIITLPALKHSKVTIVNLKQQRELKKRSWWETCFLDIIFLGISIYGYYNYSNHMDDLMQRALKGEALDPLLYISSSLFILGMGLLFLRFQPLLAKIVFFIGRKRFKPAAYASFTEIIKNGRKQQYIMLFMILTVSLGMFNAVSARTIAQNTLNNVEYLSGADLVVQEVWGNNAAFSQSDPSIKFQYYEPDYAKYASMTGAKSYTKVIDEKAGYISLSGNEQITVEIMGIHTREFGLSTWVSASLLEEPYYAYLNKLAAQTDGILVSRNFQTMQGYKEGDQITFYNGNGTKASGYIVGFFDYWPAYEPTTITLDGENNIKIMNNYLIVSHLSVLQQYWGITPYQIWISVKEDAYPSFFSDWVKENQVTLSMYRNRAQELEAVIEDPLLQGMNGVLTMSFIVTMLLCVAGYLIYWIMSIRSREMMFGVLRAFGMHKEEILQMLVNEQIFSGIFSILAGIVVGRISYELFVPMLQTAYSTSNQVLPLTLITQMSDMIRLYTVITLTMAVCLVVLAAFVFKLNITKALKLGEE